MKVQEALSSRFAEDIVMLSITLDPLHDSPGQLKAYARANGVKPGWTFLTGNHDDIEQLRHALGVRDPDPIVDADPSQHAGLLVYGSDPLNRWSAIYSLAPPEQIIAALERLLELNQAG